VQTGTTFEAEETQHFRDGATLMFSQLSGELDAILLDEGWLSGIRAALAGSIAAKHLSPEKVSRIGVLGTGNQARLQVLSLDGIVDCRNVLVWGRSAEARHAYAADLRAAGYNVDTTADPQAVAACELIITTTASHEPLLKRVLPGSHITAVGADSPDKQELEPVLFERAGLIVADSVEQCLRRGELHHAGPELDIDAVVPLGEIVSGAHRGRTNAEAITVADLTGMAVQDIELAAAVLTSIRRS
jgi:ornithine cyclodeaminase